MYNPNASDYSYLSEKYAQADGGPGSPLPEGVYNATIDTFGIESSQKTGNDMFVMEYLISDGDFAGRKVRNYLTIPSPGDMGSEQAEWQIQALKREIGKLAPLSDIAAFIANQAKLVLDKKVTIRIKNKKDSQYQNIYLQTVEDPLPAADGDEDPMAALRKKAVKKAPAAKDPGKVEDFDPFADD